VGNGTEEFREREDKSENNGGGEGESEVELTSAPQLTPLKAQHGTASFFDRLSGASGVEAPPLTPPLRRAKMTLLDATPTGTAQPATTHARMSPLIHGQVRRSQRRGGGTSGSSGTSGGNARSTVTLSPTTSAAELRRPLQNRATLDAIADELRYDAVLGDEVH